MDAGKLTLDMAWDGAVVAVTDIRSTRPQAAQVLRGRTPSQALHIVPLLFGVCGQAQGAAARAALLAAQQGDLQASAAQERAIVCEAIQEHLWRLLLDWPALLGQEQRQRRFADWHALLRRIGVGETGMEVFLREFERDALGVPVSVWRALDSHAALQTWWRETETPVAKSLALLAELEPGRDDSGASRLLPAWTASEAQQACAGRWDAAFAARPEWGGAAAETGAWAYHAGSPLLRDTWQRSGSRALTRLLARIVDVVEMASGSAEPRLDSASPAAGEGIAAVRTARGLLLHRAQVADETVLDYVIVAPTEWNFHPRGAFAQGMSGLAAPDARLLKRRAQIEALSLDPCVAYEIEVHHA